MFCVCRKGSSCQKEHKKSVDIVHQDQDSKDLVHMEGIMVRNELCHGETELSQNDLETSVAKRRKCNESNRVVDLFRLFQRI